MMNDIIAFVEKAMECNLNIGVWSGNNITIYDNNGNGEIEFSIINNRINIITNHLNRYIEETKLSDLDISAFEFLCARVKNYSQNKSLEYFNNFFKDAKIISINDLDDKED